MKCTLHVAAALIGLFLPLSASAAPPTLNTIFPAGGQRGTTVTVTLGGTFDPWPALVWTSGKGVEVKPAKDAGKLLITIAADATPGAYEIRLVNDEGASLPRPFLVGTLPEAPEQEPNDDPKKPHTIDQTGVTINGRLEKKVGDVDHYALNLKKGQTLVASLEAYRTLRSPMDAHLQIVTPDGLVLEQNDDFHLLDPHIAFVVPRDGTYLVRTFAFPSVPDSGIRFAGGEKFIYRLTLTTGAFADYAYPLAVSRAAADKKVTLIGWNLPPELTTVPVPADDKADRVTLFHPQLANTVQVRLEPHAAIVEDPPTSPRTLQKLELPVTVTGRIEHPGEKDGYRFFGKKGQKLNFRAEAQSLGFPLDPVLRLSDGSGAPLNKMQAKALRTDPSLDFTVPEDGPYQLEVSDLYGSGSRRHVYRLRAGPPQPDFTLKVAADRFVLTAGKPLDIPVTLERTGGFNQDVELTVLGLPPGVTATTIPGKAKGPTLRLTSDSAPFSGPIRIVGTAKGLPLSRTAQATLTEVDSPTALTENLWLTLVKAK